MRVYLIIYLFSKTVKVLTGEYVSMKAYNVSSPSSLTYAKSFQLHSSYVNRIKQSPFDNSNYVATCSNDASVKIWNSYDWTLVQTYASHNSYVYTVEWLDRDTLASSGAFDGTIKIWSLSSGLTKRTINTNGEGVYSLKLLNNQIHLAAGCYRPNDIKIYKQC